MAAEEKTSSIFWNLMTPLMLFWYMVAFAVGLFIVLLVIGFAFALSVAIVGAARISLKGRRDA